jgi:hypothetical protein
MLFSLEKLAALNLSAPQLELVKAGIGAAGKSWIWSATPSSMTIWSQPCARLKQN